MIKKNYILAILIISIISWFALSAWNNKKIISTYEDAIVGMNESMVFEKLGSPDKEVFKGDVWWDEPMNKSKEQAVKMVTYGSELESWAFWYSESNKLVDKYHYTSR